MPVGPSHPGGRRDRASQHPSPHVPIERLDGNADLVVQGPHVLREDLEILQLLTGAVGVEPLDARALRRRTGCTSRVDLAGVAEACAAAGYDWALVPRARACSRACACVAMDMDSTLITIECIDEIAALRGIGDEVAAITAAAMRGEIDFRASLERRVALLAGMPVDRRSRASTTSGCGSRRALRTARRVRAHRREDAAGLRRLHVLHRPAASAPRASTTRCRTCSRSSTASLTGRISGDIVDADAKAACFARPRRSLSRRRRPRGRDRRRRERPADAGARRRFGRLSREAARARAGAVHAIDHCGLDAVLNLFA